MKAILWDLDDTLLDTLSGRMAALAYAHERCLGTRTDPEALWRSHRGGSLELLGQRLLGDEGPRFAAAYRDHYYRSDRIVKPFAGVPELLRALSNAGFRHAIVTSKISWGATEELQQTGLLELFEAIVGVDDVEKAKPDPEPVYEALHRLCLDDPRDGVFVGDSPADIWTARNAGCASIAALWGTIDEELLLDATPDFCARSPGDVLQIIKGLEQADG